MYPWLQVLAAILWMHYVIYVAVNSALTLPLRNKLGQRLADAQVARFEGKPMAWWRVLPRWWSATLLSCPNCFAVWAAIAPSVVLTATDALPGPWFFWPPVLASAYLVADPVLDLTKRLAPKKAQP